MSVVLWHDIECGAYDADLPLWREVARSPVLDVGAGTGRVALDLAARGHEVLALDADAELLAALRERCAGRVRTVLADARDFELGQRFASILVPMQTAQLLGGAEGRSGFLRCALAHLAPGASLHVALADALESFSAEDDLLPLPDRREVDGVEYASRPLAVVDEGGCVAIHRLRETVRPGGRREVADDVVRLDRVTPEELEAEGAAAGFTVGPSRRIPETDDYVGSTVVRLEAPG